MSLTWKIIFWIDNFQKWPMFWYNFWIWLFGKNNFKKCVIGQFLPLYLKGVLAKKNCIFISYFTKHDSQEVNLKNISFFIKTRLTLILSIVKTSSIKRDWYWSDNLTRSFWKYLHMDLVFDKDEIQFIYLFFQSRLFGKQHSKFYLSFGLVY